jgi:hypothetical protein
MGEVPVYPGAVQETVSVVGAVLTAVTAVGAPGTLSAGVTGEEEAEAGPVPSALVAVTVKVYAVPLVSPVTMHVGVVVAVQVKPPGLEVTV